LSDQILPPTTAGIFPEKFVSGLVFDRDRRLVICILIILTIIGFGLRVTNLGAESFGEDELNKLQTVEEYRQNGLSGKNGEHPFLMKGMQTLSVSAAERINSIAPAASISVEAALRFPVAFFGTLTILLLYLLVAELFGRSIALVSAVLWAVEPMAIGFDRIAKEDSLVLFFFLVTNFFWLRSQTAAERGSKNWTWWAWAAAAGFAALMASKYYPYLLGITAAYYIIFRALPDKGWEMLSVRWLKFLTVMGVSFLILNPTIVLPETWREMLKFSSENRIGHDSYEFMGTLYRNQMSAWLAGVPWTFFFVFAAVKTSLLTLVLFALGLPLTLQKRLGDGRFFIFFWAFVWLISFTFIGGKFTRYFTVAAPIIFIVAAVAICFLLDRSTRRLPSLPRTAIQVAVLAILVAFPLLNSTGSSPHFRMFNNSLGGGSAAAGSYFPHDEFYDAATREVVADLMARAKTEALVACETPALYKFYAEQGGRPDLEFISLSDPEMVARLTAGDLIVTVSGRRYFSNQRYLDFLQIGAKPAFEVRVANAVAARGYMLDKATLTGILSLVQAR